MAPGITETNAHSEGQVKSENAKSVKALSELLSRLSVSKSQDEINAASLDIATLINGDIEEQDAPTQ
jgi:elongation factor 3